MGTDGRHLQVLRELADVTARPLLIIFERLWWLGDVLGDCKKANVTSVFKKEDLGNYRPVSLTLVPGKLVDQILLETVSTRMKDKNVIRNSRHRFMKGNSY